MPTLPVLREDELRALKAVAAGKPIFVNMYQRLKDLNLIGQPVGGWTLTLLGKRVLEREDSKRE